MFAEHDAIKREAELLRRLVGKAGVLGAVRLESGSGENEIERMTWRRRNSNSSSSRSSSLLSLWVWEWRRFIIVIVLWRLQRSWCWQSRRVPPFPPALARATHQSSTSCSSGSRCYWANSNHRWSCHHRCRRSTQCAEYGRGFEIESHVSRIARQVFPITESISPPTSLEQSAVPGSTSLTYSLRETLNDW